jgi:regulator of nonsense transcripts 1
MNFVSYVSQNIIQGPSFAPRLEVRHFQRRFAGEAVRWLLEGQFPWNRHQVPIPVGITLDQDSSQQITSIALSTPTRGVSISIDGSSLRELKTIPNDTVFLSLMRGEVRFRSSKKSDWTCEDGEEYMNSFVLVGFDVARTAVLVLKYVGIRFRGVDLGTLIAPEAMAPWTPGRLVRGRVKRDVDQWKVNKCWDESGSQDAFYLRAWISQWYVASFF